MFNNYAQNETDKTTKTTTTPTEQHPPTPTPTTTQLSTTPSMTSITLVGKSQQ